MSADTPNIATVVDHLWSHCVAFAPSHTVGIVALHSLPSSHLLPYFTPLRTVRGHYPEIAQVTAGSQDFAEIKDPNGSSDDEAHTSPTCQDLATTDQDSGEKPAMPSDFGTDLTMGQHLSSIDVDQVMYSPQLRKDRSMSTRWKTISSFDLAHWHIEVLDAPPHSGHSADAPVDMPGTEYFGPADKADRYLGWAMDDAFKDDDLHHWIGFQQTKQILRQRNSEFSDPEVLVRWWLRLENRTAPKFCAFQLFYLIREYRGKIPTNDATIPFFTRKLRERHPIPRRKGEVIVRSKRDASQTMK